MVYLTIDQKFPQSRGFVLFPASHSAVGAGQEACLCNEHHVTWAWTYIPVLKARGTSYPDDPWVALPTLVPMHSGC